MLTLTLSLAAWAARLEVAIQGMTCGMCEARITKELNATGKCQKVQVSAKDQRAVLEERPGSTLSDAEIKAAVKKAGYSAVKITRH